MAIAVSDAGRHHFVSTDETSFVAVNHFPASVVEAKQLVQGAAGSPVTAEQLTAIYGSRVVLVPMQASAA